MMFASHLYTFTLGLMFDYLHETANNLFVLRIYCGKCKNDLTPYITEAYLFIKIEYVGV